MLGNELGNDSPVMPIEYDLEASINIGGLNDCDRALEVPVRLIVYWSRMICI